jgi:predicted nucleic acid-binding protein
LDLVTDDSDWFDWSATHLDAAALRGRLAINAVIYAELSVRFGAIEDVEDLLDEAGIVVEMMPRAALFLAGKAFQSYRARGGARTGVLPDLFIGAHAAVMGHTLLSRDTRRWRTYFPTLELISP